MTYKEATRGLALILCNIVAERDNLEYEFDWGDDTYIYQYYLTDIYNEYVLDYYKKRGLKFAYDTDLDLYVLCVDHFGTAWDGVEIREREEDSEDDDDD